MLQESALLAASELLDLLAVFFSGDFFTDLLLLFLCSLLSKYAKNSIPFLVIAYLRY